MNENNTIIQVPIYQALVKIPLYAGVEREFTVLIAFISVITFIVGKDFISVLLAILFWFVGILLGRMAAYIDPQLIKIFSRHAKYADFYPACERVDAPVRNN